MPFFWDWVWEKLSGVSKTAEKPQGLGRPEVENQVREEVVQDGGTIPTRKGDPVVESIRVRSNNTGKTARKSTGAAVRAPTSKNKAKSKAVPKG